MPGYNPKLPRPNPGQLSDTRAELRRRINTDKPVQASVPDDPESAVGQTIARWGTKLNPTQVAKILKMHSTGMDEFTKEMGSKAVYSTKKLFDWLGY